MAEETNVLETGGISEEKFLQRKMKGKLSVFKCTQCEEKNAKGSVTPFLFHKVSRGDKCPICGSSHVQKISIYAVIELRWNKSVRPQIMNLRHAP